MNTRVRLLCRGVVGLYLAMFGSCWAALPIQRWTTPAGAEVYFVETHALPIVDVQIDFDAGSRRDPEGKAGLAGTTADMMGRGLAARPDGEAIDENALSEAWADLGASFEGGASADRMSFSLRSLSDRDLLAKALRLASRQLAEPAFPPAVWERERQRAIASLREAATRPATVAWQAYARAVYGTHPYGAQATEASLAAIGVADMAAFHGALLAPCRARLTIVGDLRREEAQGLVEGLLGRMKAPSGGKCQPLTPVPEVAALASAVDQRIPFASAQAHVLLGQPGIRRDDPDYFPLTVGNYILGGGGFVSRLTAQVREKRGLSYSVYSYFSPGLHAGAFTVGLQTRPDQAGEAVRIAREVVSDFIARGPTEAELEAAKAFLVGGFALRLDSNRKLLDNLANIAWYSLPLDYLDTYSEKVARVRTEDIRAAFARRIDPARLALVVVGGDRQPVDGKD